MIWQPTRLAVIAAVVLALMSLGSGRPPTGAPSPLVILPGSPILWRLRLKLGFGLTLQGWAGVLAIRAWIC